MASAGAGCKQKGDRVDMIGSKNYMNKNTASAPGSAPAPALALALNCFSSAEVSLGINGYLDPYLVTPTHASVLGTPSATAMLAKVAKVAKVAEVAKVAKVAKVTRVARVAK